MPNVRLPFKGGDNDRHNTVDVEPTSRKLEEAHCMNKMRKLEYWIGWEAMGQEALGEPRAYFKCQEGDRWWLFEGAGLTRDELAAEINRRESAGIDVPDQFREALGRLSGIQGSRVS
ncbi:MAG TPA: hypothetical protein VN812_01930 [Candidatus Acidoferrales bacterium]|nr:hypothetical protein [Candidatus Acidoferrales bacterium]